MTNQGNKHNQYIGYRVYDAQRSLQRSLEVALKPYGVTPGQWNLLNQLDRMGPLSQKALADRTRKEQATITRYIDNLTKKGLVTREADPHDRRAYLIVLTDQAKDLLATTEPVATNAANSLTTDISQDEIDAFLDVLQRLKENADDFVESLSKK